MSEGPACAEAEPSSAREPNSACRIEIWFAAIRFGRRGGRHFGYAIMPPETAFDRGISGRSAAAGRPYAGLGDKTTSFPLDIGQPWHFPVGIRKSHPDVAVPIDKIDTAIQANLSDGALNKIIAKYTV